MAIPKISLSDEIRAQLGAAIPGVNGSAVPPALRKAIDYALQELVKAAKPATRRSAAEPANPVQFVVEKLRAFAQQERDRVSAGEMAKIRKRRGGGGKGRGRRRGSVVCSSAAHAPAGWTPTPVPKSDEIRAQLHVLAAKSILLHGANEFTIKTVVDCMFERAFEARAVIIKEGDPGDNFYLCTEGWTEVYKLMDVEEKLDEADVVDEGEAGEPTVSGGGAIAKEGKTTQVDKMVARLEVGATFGELALMYNAPRSATVKAGDDGAVCWAIDRLTFRSVVRNAVESRRQAYKDALSSVPILSPLSSYEHAKLADCVEEEKFEPNSVILKEGDQGDYFYIMLDGEVKVTKMGYDTKSGLEAPVEVCARLKKGSYFGEVALLMNVPRQATVTTTELTRVARIDRDVFKRVLGSLGNILERNMELYGKYEEQ
jgi:cAMP-dependent protein kinase regulator